MARESKRIAHPWPKVYSRGGQTFFSRAKLKDFFGEGLKIQNFAHTETDTPEMIKRHNIKWFVENKYGHHGPGHHERFEIIQVDDYYPEYIRNNLEKYKNMIQAGAMFRATDLYR